MKKIYSFLILSFVFVSSLTAQNRMMLRQKLFTQSSLMKQDVEADTDGFTYLNGYYSDYTLSNASYVFDILGDVVYTLKKDKIYGYNITTGTIVYESTLFEGTGNYPSFLKIDSSNNSAYVGFTVDGDKDDYIYKLDMNTNKWTEVIKLACNFDVEIYNNRLYISGLGYSDWNGIDDKNSIWVLPLDGSKQLQKIIEVPGNSCGLAISSNGTLVTGKYDLNKKSYGVYMWDDMALEEAYINNKVLTTTESFCLANLSNGIYDCTFDKDDNLYWNINSFTTPSYVVKWNNVNTNCPYDKIMSAKAGTWFTTLVVSGDASNSALWVASYSQSPVKVMHHNSDLYTDSEESYEPNFASKVLEYCPAPGQFINTTSYGTREVANKTAGNNILKPFGRRLVSLGSFGGYIVYGFDKPIKNDKDNPYGVDFTVFGNPFYGSSEPGIVQVMKDENGNGKPDDTWYELQGSDHFLKSTIRDFSVTFTNPKGLFDVPYVTSGGTKGIVKYMGQFHSQNHYPEAKNFPNISQDAYTLEGTRLRDRTYKKTIVVNCPFDYGYADNTIINYNKSKPFIPDNPYTTDVVEGYGGDAFDINWAVDKDGNHVVLDEINFVRIYNGLLADGAILGEVSTEVGGVCAAKPDPYLTGATDIIVSSQPENVGVYPIEDKGEIGVGEKFQFNTVVLSMGTPNLNQEIEWVSADEKIATVTDTGLLMGIDNGETTITASWKQNPQIKREFVVKVSGEKSTAVFDKDQNLFKVYPNPSMNKIMIEGVHKGDIKIYNCVGVTVYSQRDYSSSRSIDITSLPSGFYYIEIQQAQQTYTLKLLKQ